MGKGPHPYWVPVGVVMPSDHLRQPEDLPARHPPPIGPAQRRRAVCSPQPFFDAVCMSITAQRRNTNHLAQQVRDERAISATREGLEKHDAPQRQAVCLPDQADDPVQSQSHDTADAGKGHIRVQPASTADGGVQSDVCQDQGAETRPQTEADKGEEKGKSEGRLRGWKGYWSSLSPVSLPTYWSVTLRSLASVLILEFGVCFVTVLVKPCMICLYVFQKAG